MGKNPVPVRNHCPGAGGHALCFWILPATQSWFQAFYRYDDGWSVHADPWRCAKLCDGVFAAGVIEYCFALGHSDGCCGSNLTPVSLSVD